MMMVYSLMLCSMPQHGHCILKVCGRGGGSFGLCGRLFSKPHSPGIRDVVRFGFAWLAWFCWPMPKAFPWLGEAAVEIFQLP